MRDRGNKLHLQLGQLDRAEHFASLDGPDGSAGQRQGNTENTDQPEDGAPRGGSDVGKLLRRLLVVEPLRETGRRIPVGDCYRWWLRHKKCFGVSPGPGTAAHQFCEVPAPSQHTFSEPQRSWCEDRV